MRAFQIEGPGIVKEINVPIPEIGDDECLVRVVYSGICATDYEILGGEMTLIKEGKIRYPVRFGHEWSGIVEKVGPKVTDFAVGDRVISDPGVTCGKCAACAEGRWPDCPDIKSVGTVNCWDGSFAEYMHFPQRHLYKIPDSISLMDAALLEPSGIALEGLKKARDLKNKTVLIVGTGAIGMTAVAMSRHYGPAKVILAGRTDGKLEIGRKLGADVTVNVRNEDLQARVMQETNGQGADFVLETSGNIQTINQCVLMVKNGGGAAFIGFYDRPIDSFPIDAVVSRELTVSGVMGHFGTPGQVIDIVKGGDINLRPIITHVISMDEIPMAMVQPEKLPGSRIKIMVQVSGEPA